MDVEHRIAAERRKERRAHLEEEASFFWVLSAEYT
jgi:hypothetical protein